MRPGGFQRECDKRTGGVAAVALVAAADITGAEFDVRSGAFTRLTLMPGATVVPYEFREGSGRFSETMSLSGGAAKVRHEITFTLTSAGDGAGLAVRELSELSAAGLVALVVTTGGHVLLVGYSHGFGGERPLKMSGCVYDAGAGSADEPGYRVTLVAEDVSFSYPVHGCVAVLVLFYVVSGDVGTSTAAAGNLYYAPSLRGGEADVAILD